MTATESARLMIRLIRVRGIDLTTQSQVLQTIKLQDNRTAHNLVSCRGSELKQWVDYVHKHPQGPYLGEAGRQKTGAGICSSPLVAPLRCGCPRNRAKMLRTVLSAVAPKVAVANRSLLPAARRSPLTSLASSCQGGRRSVALDCAASAATASRSIAARKCSHRDMTVASARVATSVSVDSGATQAGGERDGQSEGGIGSARDARDPVTGEGRWMDEEDEVCGEVLLSCYLLQLPLFHSLSEAAGLLAQCTRI